MGIFSLKFSLLTLKLEYRQYLAVLKAWGKGFPNLVWSFYQPLLWEPKGALDLFPQLSTNLALGLLGGEGSACV